MSDQKKESLSVLMDGELDEMALHRFLKQVDGEPELRDTWSRFHLQRDVIKGDVSEFSTLDISSAISATIADETQLQVNTTGYKSMWKAVAGLSVAASVAFAVVLGARFNPLMESPVGSELAGKTEVIIATPEMTKVHAPSMVAQSTPDLDGVDAKSLQAAQKRLNSYLKQHAQDSALGQGRTSMPFARVVNYETGSKVIKGN